MGRQSLSLGRRQSSRLAIEEIAINARQQRLLELKASAKDANKGATTNPQLLWSKFSKNGGIVWHWSLRRRHSIESCLDDCSVCAGLEPVESCMSLRFAEMALRVFAQLVDEKSDAALSERARPIGFEAFA
jgi:hypothetical protein